MNENINQSSNDLLKQNICQFNDKLLEKLKNFFSKKVAIQSICSKTLIEQSYSCSNNHLPIEKIDETLSETSFNQTAPKDIEIMSSLHEKIDKQIFKKRLQNRSKNPSSQTVRLWENTLYFESENNQNKIDNSKLSLGKIDFFADNLSGKFESDSEQQAEMPIEVNLSKKMESVQFLTYKQSVDTVYQGTGLFDFGELIEKLEKRNLKFKHYECDQCFRKFYNPAALGGHKSKQHPKSSRRYNERKNTFSLRKGERKKRSFLNNL